MKHLPSVKTRRARRVRACGRVPARADVCGRVQHVRTRADACGRVRTRADACERVRTRADACGHVQTRADACGQVRTRADACQRVRTRAQACGRVQYADACGLAGPTFLALLGRALCFRGVAERPPSVARTFERPCGPGNSRQACATIAGAGKVASRGPRACFLSKCWPSGAERKLSGARLIAEDVGHFSPKPNT